MKNCLIMGFGRSGTSLMGGILYQAGYFLGENLYPPRQTNPKGFFECDMINSINEEILEPYDYCRIKECYTFSKNKPYSPLKPSNSQRWLSYIQPGSEIKCSNHDIEIRIIKAMNTKPFAFKDPRFNYTLPIWSKFVTEDTTFICMFREPEVTISSVIKECQNSSYLSNFYINYRLAEFVWINSYINILKQYYKNRGKFVFVHYKQLLNGSVLNKISDTLEIELKSDFISRELNRTNNNYKIGEKTFLIYKELCEIANYKHKD